MTKTDTQTFIQKYEKIVREWDDQSQELTDEQRTVYERHRNQFLQRLNAWMRRAALEWDTLTDNIEEGFHELEARWIKINR